MQTSRRPWWGNPLFWLAVCAVFIVLGVFVWPKLFGGVFLFLPFFWIGRRPRKHREDGSDRDEAPVEGY